MLLYIVTRHMSPYTSKDLYLGVYSTKQNASSAAAQYRADIVAAGGPEQDQCYMTVDLKKDVEIIPFETGFDIEADAASEYIVHLLFDVGDCMGQIDARLHSIEATIRKLRVAGEQLRIDGGPMVYCMSKRMVVDSVAPDLGEMTYLDCRPQS